MSSHNTALSRRGSPALLARLPVVGRFGWHVRELSRIGEDHCNDTRNKPSQAAAEKLTGDFSAYQQNEGVFGPSGVIASLPRIKRQPTALLSSQEL